jgi:membrane dipeptidase
MTNDVGDARSELHSQSMPFPMHISDLHQRALVLDAVCPGGYWFENYREWIAGGANACAISVGSDGPARHALYALANTYRFARERDAELRLATSVRDIRQAKADRKLAIILHFQGTMPMEYDPDLLEAFWRLGVRIIQLAYNTRNPLCDGCEEPSDAGLSVLGVRAVAEMNRLGILIDVTHTGTRSSLEAIEASTAPCIASHSNAAAVQQNSRNLPDELIRAIAASGGVIGMNGFPSFVHAHPRPSLDQFIDHFVYIDSLVGSGHVGIGLDYYAGGQAEYQSLIASGSWNPKNYTPPPYHYPAGLDTPSALPRLTERLSERGYTDNEIIGILGENWLRVYAETWGD